MLSANAVLPMFMLLAAGFLSQKAGVLTREDVPRFNKVAFRIFLPCLLFYNIYCSDLSAAVKPGLIIYAVCGVLLVFTAAYLSVQHLVRREDWKGVIAQGIFRSNFVIMGIPIAQVLVGADQLGAVTVLIAVVVPLLGLLEQTVSSLSVIASPLQLFLLGAFFRFDGLGRYLKPLTAVTTVKLFVTPALLLGTAALLGIRGGDFVGLIGIFASPTAVNSFTMVQQMDCGDAELAGDIVVMTSAVSILSFFLWILVFKSLGIF